jgi:hypothetical protein
MNEAAVTAKTLRRQAIESIALVAWIVKQSSGEFLSVRSIVLHFVPTPT